MLGSAVSGVGGRERGGWRPDFLLSDIELELERDDALHELGSMLVVALLHVLQQRGVRYCSGGEAGSRHCLCEIVENGIE